MSNDIVDLNQKRLDRAIEKSGTEPLGGRPPPGASVVEVLSCNCGSFEFRLGHRDPVNGKAQHIVICAKCNVCIESLAWWDKNLEPPPVA